MRLFGGSEGSVCVCVCQFSALSLGLTVYVTGVFRVYKTGSAFSSPGATGG